MRVVPKLRQGHSMLYLEVQSSVSDFVFIFSSFLLGDDDSRKGVKKRGEVKGE